MKLVRWDPFLNVLTMSNRLDRSLEPPVTARTDASFGGWVPPVDIFESQDTSSSVPKSPVSTGRTWTCGSKTAS